jgi:hypothetical protein
MKVWQYNKNGIYVRTFNSYSEAAKSIGTYTGNISNAIKYNIRAKGYYWRTAKGKKELKIPVSKYRRGGQRINIYKNGKFIYLASTYSEAVQLTGIPHSTIRNNCRGKEILNKIYSFKFEK